MTKLILFFKITQKKYIFLSLLFSLNLIYESKKINTSPPSLQRKRFCDETVAGNFGIVYNFTHFYLCSVNRFL